MSFMEKRQHRRVTMVTKVTLQKSGTDQYYYSRDISRGGLFLETKRPYESGTRLYLHFTLPGREHPVEAEGEVVRTVKYDRDTPNIIPGMGIVFNEVSPESISAIISFLEESNEQGDTTL